MREEEGGGFGVCGGVGCMCVRVFYSGSVKGGREPQAGIPACPSADSRGCTGAAAAESPSCAPPRPSSGAPPLCASWPHTHALTHTHAGDQGALVQPALRLRGRHGPCGGGGGGSGERRGPSSSSSGGGSRGWAQRQRRRGPDGAWLRGCASLRPTNEWLTAGCESIGLGPAGPRGRALLPPMPPPLWLVEERRARTHTVCRVQLHAQCSSGCKVAWQAGEKHAT